MKKCDNQCKYYCKAFDHEFSDKACSLSDAYSVNKGSECSYYDQKIEVKEINDS